nr:hypothetical protein [Tanacetum cinerariifolium]
QNGWTRSRKMDGPDLGGSAFQVTADVPEIYMQEFWATAKLHRNSIRFKIDTRKKIYMQEFWATAKLHHNFIRFKIDTRKSVLDLESFKEMLHISPRIPNQPFADLPTKEEVLDFLRFLGHSHDIRYLTDVNVNKLYQPWRSFVYVINKCLTGKSSRVDSFILSQAQMLWGFYHIININFAYLIWEDFVYQPSISRRNRIHWHYVRDDALFSTIKVVSRHQATQQYGAILPIELTSAKIRNSKAYQEYYACAMGEAAPKPKASARKKKVILPLPLLLLLQHQQPQLRFHRNTYKVDYIVCTNSMWYWIMATTIEQQTALDESLVPNSQRLRIGRCNFRLPSDIQSKEATLQVVYDVLRNSPLFRAFQVTADVPEIYMQEFWATAKIHHTSVRFKIDIKKSILNLEAFREMLHVRPR